MGSTFSSDILHSSTLTLKEEDFPAVFEFGDGALRVTVFLHEVLTAQGNFRCWSYVTDGVRAFQQRPFEAIPFEQQDLVLTVAVEPDASPLELPTEPFGFLVSVWSTTAEGSRLEEGGRVQGHSLLGSAAAILTLAWPQAGVEIKFGSFQIVPVTEEELEAVTAFGYARVLSVLGQVYRFYPYPSFWDRNRASVLTAESVEASLLAKVARCWVRGRVRMEQRQVTLRLWRDNAAALAASFEALPLLAPVALLPHLDPQADGCLSFRPNQPLEPFVITPPGTRSLRVAGCFLAFFPAEDQAERIVIYEDGFVLLLELENLIAVRQALSEGRPWAFAGGENGLTFLLEWGECSKCWFDPAGVMREQEGCEVYVPHDIDPDYNKRPVRATITAGLPIEVMNQRIDMQAFGAYCDVLANVFTDLLLPLAEGAAFNFCVLVRLWTDGTGELEFGHLGEVKDIEALHGVSRDAVERLKQIEKPKVSDAVHFELTFQVGAGASEAYQNVDA